MRRYHSLVAGVLLLGCSDDGSKTTAPQLAGAVVGVSADHRGHGSAASSDIPKLAITLLRGDEEVPPRGTHANGQLWVKITNDGEALQYFLEVNDILNVTQAHIHMQARGVNGPIVVWLFPNVKSTAALPGGGGLTRHMIYEGTITAADLRGPLAGQPLGALFGAIVQGNTYGNVHTEDGNPATTNSGPGDFPGGEIRGQLKH